MTTDPSDPPLHAGLLDHTGTPDPLDAAPRPEPAPEAHKTRIRAALFDGKPLPPEHLGRFIVLGSLGQGGMGTVLEAYDPTLDRKIALKVLHTRVAQRHARRQVREAKGLAKLSHPNVVQIYEVGEAEGRTFIAMELITGQTLHGWQQQQPRPSWRRCVEVYLQAGRGLAAAHAAGLVHRDFKPENCIIDDQGRVRVLDFGLVRALDEASGAPQDGATPGALAATGASEPPLTTTGAVLGTIAYMPLEQLEGEPVDAKSDQFSFCVSLYEAVYGERPFAGNTLGTLTRSLASGRLRSAPAGSKVPAKLRRLLLRGLARSPQQRWPSMDALLGELERLIAPGRGRWLLLGLGLAAVGLGLWQQRPAVEQVTVRERCEGAEAQLAGIWDQERRREVEAAILGTGESFARDTWQRVQTRLDRYTGQWADAYIAVCEAAGSVEGPSAEDTALRYECLSQRSAALREAVTVLASLDEASVSNALHVVESLPRLERCDDLEALRADLPPPEDPKLAREVEQLRGRLARARSLYEAGAVPEQQAELEAVVAAAEELGWPPLLAEALTQHAEAMEAGDPAREPQMERGYYLALEHDHTAVAAFAATQMIAIVGDEHERHAKGLEWGKTALALASRPAADRDTEAEALMNIAMVSSQRGDREAALDSALRSLRLREASLAPDDHRLARALAAVGMILQEHGRVDEALRHYERSLSIRREAFGRGHPEVDLALTYISTTYMIQGRFDEALQLYRQALADAEAELGESHPNLAPFLESIAWLFIRRGTPERALPHARRALALHEAAFGPSHEGRRRWLWVIGKALIDAGRLDEALDVEREILALVESTLGTEHPDYIDHLAHIADIHRDQGDDDRALEFYRRYVDAAQAAWGPEDPRLAATLSRFGGSVRPMGRRAEARDAFQRSLVLMESTLGLEHVQVAEPLVALAELELEQRRFEEARALARRAIAILEANVHWPADLARARFTLARASWPDRQRRARAIELAEQARDTLKAMKEERFAKEQLDSIETWLAIHS